MTPALVASAGAMILGYGLKGALAVYLPGGIDENHYPPEGLYALFMFDDLGPFIAWYGVAMATAAVAWLSLAERRLRRWFGAASLCFLLAPVAMLVGTGLPGFPAIVQPSWLIVVGAGLALVLRDTPADAPEPGFAAMAD